MTLDRAFLDNLRVRSAGRIEWGPGLSAGELDAAERKWGLKFPPDLRFFLETMTGGSDSFTHWARTADEVIAERLAWPFEGFCFDIEHSDLWLPAWGPKPETLAGRIKAFRPFCEAAPKLIPIFSHRYLPSEPSAAGNPVFSVYQSDIIYYGANLGNYLENEFFGRWDINPWPVKTRIAFWSDWAEGECDDALA